MQKILPYSPNMDMVKVLKNEQGRLKNVAILFSCMDSNSFPSCEFFNEMQENIRVEKLGIFVSFCRMMYKGLFIIVFKSHGI